MKALEEIFIQIFAWSKNQKGTKSRVWHTLDVKKIMMPTAMYQQVFIMDDRFSISLVDTLMIPHRIKRGKMRNTL